MYIVTVSIYNSRKFLRTSPLNLSRLWVCEKIDQFLRELFCFMQSWKTRVATEATLFFGKYKLAATTSTALSDLAQVG
jgi:hypothetical protein